ncbi:hypothetical protein B0H17DRAFT_1123980 [Mycena rosella]|uniref:Uncharacterized protein n=1 Tax=Mycena rosella TaxID=1033263 RepID=A0AAD7H3F8_MYCRO|nr:hypothetical protein B0H17DRAFT_1123980 [Mycena rosella]
MSAVLRGGLASVCQHWASIIYGDSALWSMMSISLRVSPEAHGFPEKQFQAEQFFDSLFTIIGPTLPRWKSFVFSCRHPTIFEHVNCATLLSIRLKSISLLYWSIPDRHSPEARQALRPYVPCKWFGSLTSLLSALEFNGVPLMWDTPALFDILVTVVFHDMPSMIALNWKVFSTLFDSAHNLKILRIGNIRLNKAPIPPIPLLSRSLEELDVTFLSSANTSSLFQHMHLPNVKLFVVRAVHGIDFQHTLECIQLLSRVTQFTLYGWFGGANKLWPLFDRLAAVEMVDFTHAGVDAFGSFYTWTLRRSHALNPFRSALVSELSVGHVRTCNLRGYCHFRVRIDPSPRPLSSVQLEEPLFFHKASISSDKDVKWFHNHVPIVQTTHFYQENSAHHRLPTFTSHPLHRHF